MNADAGRSYWERHAKNYDRSMRLFGGPVPAMVDLVAQAASGAREALEIGCGTGIVTAALARSAEHVVATDYSSRMLATTEARLRREGLTNVELAEANVEALPYADGRFDVTVAANVLHLVPDVARALREMRRVTRDGGLVVVPTYCHAETRRSRLVSRLLAVTGFPGRRRLTLVTLRGIVSDSALRVEKDELLRGILPIGVVIARRQGG